MFEDERVYLEFKYLRNVMIMLGDGVYHAIPMKNIEVDRDGYKLLLPHFDMEYVHKVELLNETPHLPDREDAGSDRQYEDMCDDAYSEARVNRLANDKIRRIAYDHHKRKTIEILSDPFKARKVKTSLGPTLPTEMIAQAKAEAEAAAPVTRKKK